MFKTYEAPVVELVGDFRQDTGEFIGPHEEQILMFEDHSA